MSDDPYALDCAPGEEAWPGEDGYACGPADPAVPDANAYPDPLPLDPLPEREPIDIGLVPLDPPLVTGPEQVTPGEVQPVAPPRELAETGPVDPLTILLFGGIVLSAGVATWLTRMSKKEDA